MMPHSLGRFRTIEKLPSLSRKQTFVDIRKSGTIIE